MRYLAVSVGVLVALATAVLKATNSCRSWALYLVALAAVVICSRVSIADEGEVAPNKYGILVGCTKYPKNKSFPTLRGPENDVRVFADVLKSRFGFADENITVLAGWPEEKGVRPSRKNITAAFERLIEQTEPGDQVVILLAGHGTQAPIPEDQKDPWDPANPEPDGMDEYFLPADAGAWSQDGIRNAIRDNVLGEWLDRIREREASAWVIFDCCHAGTMSRSIDDVERDRGITPREVGVPDEVLEANARKVRETRAQRGEQASFAAAPPIRLPQSAGRGSLVTFYAAQPHERAPELPLPRDTREHVYGQFSYALCQVLQQSEGTLTYRDLARRISSYYRAERGSRPPTPLFDGELDRDVLGADLGPRVPIYLEKAGRGMQLSAGALIGLTRGTVLAVHTSGAEAREGEKVLAYVRVRDVGPASAKVESIAYDDHAAVPADDLPDAARCRIVELDVGEMEVTVALEGKEISPDRFAKVKEALAALPDEVRQLVRVVNDVADAEWVLRLVSPKTAQKQFDISIDKPRVFLLPGTGRKEAVVPEATPRVFRNYPAEDAEELAHALRGDLQKIFAWQNLWRVAISLEKHRAVETGRDGIDFQVVRLDDDAPGGQEQKVTSQADNILYPEQQVQLQFSNRKGFRDYWVTLLYLGADYRIEQWFTGTLPAGKELPPLGPVRIDDSSFGPEGFVVMAVPVREQRNQPDYSFLEQSPLGVGVRKATPREPQDPFERLMHSVTAASDVRVRAATLGAPETPQVVSWTWVTEPQP